MENELKRVALAPEVAEGMSAGLVVTAALGAVLAVLVTIGAAELDAWANARRRARAAETPPGAGSELVTCWRADSPGWDGSADSVVE